MKLIRSQIGQEETPQLYQAPRLANTLIRVDGPPSSCYICARPTECLLVIDGDTATPKLPPTKTYRLRVCQFCAWAWKLWTPPA
jgi:hypothetical protein